MNGNAARESRKFYDSRKVKDQASAYGWVGIMRALAPDLERAISRLGRHVPCPVHGGTDGFRLFKDFNVRGGAICNSCGAFGDGLSLLCFVKGIDFPEALVEVAEFLRVDPEPPRYQRREASERRPRPAQSRPREKAAEDHSAPRAVQETAVVREAAVKEASNDEWARLVKPGRRGPIDLKARAEALKAKQEGTEQSSPEDEPPAYLAERFGYEVIEHDPQPEPEPVKAPPVAPAIIIEPEKPRLALVKSKPVSASTSDRKSLNVERHWRESLPLNASQAEPARLYLQGRKVLPRGGADWLDNDCVRFHPAFPYWDTVTEVDMETGEERETIAEIGKFPAIVCAIVNNKGEILTLHRTYLSSTGSKADVESPRKMMPVPEGKSIRGAAIQMGTPVDGVLGIAEGLETALSAYRATGIATWSTVNATLLEGFTPPAGVHTVLVWADKDRSCTGESAAMRLKLRLQQQGIRVIVILPTAPIPSGSKGIDWNDVIIRQGISGFPSLALLRSVVGG
ncbi:toprim domain-containing protein (plasmid) [Pseudomonas luteola]|uniref:DUF7146 domain-containing protein n=1 Tax=Pseudomonas luteola TaxID=47886 RepID=UPI003DA14E94